MDERIQRDMQEFQADIDRIMRVCAERDKPIDAEAATEYWEAYSDAQGAVWLFLPDNDDELFAIIETVRGGIL